MLAGAMLQRVSGDVKADADSWNLECWTSALPARPRSD